MSVVRGNNNNLLITLPPPFTWPVVPWSSYSLVVRIFHSNGPTQMTILGNAASFPAILDTANLPQGVTSFVYNSDLTQASIIDCEYTDSRGVLTNVIPIEVPSLGCILQVNSIISASSAIIADVTTNTVHPTNLRMSITNPTTGVISSSIYPGFNPAYPNGPLFYYCEVMLPVPAGQNRMFIFCYDVGYNNTPNVNLTLDGCSTVVKPVDYASPSWVAITDPNDPMFTYTANNPPVEAKPLGYMKSGYTSSSSDNSMLYTILIVVILLMILSRKKR